MFAPFDTTIELINNANIRTMFVNTNNILIFYELNL